MIQLFFIICATLVQYSSEAPWDTNNNIREFDLEWQCEQFCNRIKGKLTYNSTDSSCTCTVDTKEKTDFDSKHLEDKLNDLGLNFKIVDNTLNRIKKRDTPVEIIKKLFAERNQREAPPEDQHNAIVAVTHSEPENHEEIKDKPLQISKLQRFRTKLHLPNDEKHIITAPDSLLGKAAPNLETDHKEETTDDKHEEGSLLKSPNHVEKAPNKKENVIELPQKTESEHVENKAPDTPAQKLSVLREKINALKNAKYAPILEENNTELEKDDPDVGRLHHLHIRPIISKLIIRKRLLPRPIRLGNKPPTDANSDKHVPDKLEDIRERIRKHFENLKANKPNEDGDL